MAMACAVPVQMWPQPRRSAGAAVAQLQPHGPAPAHLLLLVGLAGTSGAIGTGRVRRLCAECGLPQSMAGLSMDAYARSHARTHARTHTLTPAHAHAHGGRHVGRALPQ